MSAHDDSLPNPNTLDAFVFGVKIITGETNPEYFMEAGHDIVWITGDEVDEKSKQGEYLEQLGFHWDSSSGCWAWFV